MSKVIVIGGGPAGMMAAIKASEKHEVILLEGNEKLGKKLYITGKGRCNLTNSKDISEFFDNIPGNNTFLYSSLYTFSNVDTMKYFEENGVPLKVERGDRVFPESDRASDITSVLEKKMKENKVTVLLKSKVVKILMEHNKIRGVVLENDDIVKGDFFILATGGASYPQTGSTGDGYLFSKKAGHKIVKPFPSLVPIEISDGFIQSLQGLSLKNVELTLVNNAKVHYKGFGEMLFTHYGISGPIVLSASRFVSGRKDLKAVINLKPALTPEELDKRIQRDFQKILNKDFKNSLDELLPQKLIDVIIELSGIDPVKKVNSITKEERRNLVSLIQGLTLTVRGTRQFAEAIITAGGVDTREIDPSTMKSKLVDNLSFAGELIDVDGFTGGFNLQIAFSTGYLAGENI